MTDYTGQQWGSYRLVRPLGSGGFADVYLGEHIHLGTQAALKILTTKLASEEISRFRDEARTIMQLEHPHIVRVLDFGLENRIPFIVISYAPGGSLRQQHPRGTALPLPLVINYVKQIASALQHAHEQKLIHRDVKPDNMLIARNKELLLSDFGIVAIAHSTRTLYTQDASGTIYYMAPEQIQGKPRPASDQYALGVAVYEWLTGTFPFTGTAMEIAMQHLAAPPPPLREKIPTISPEIEQVVLRALAKKPEERFPDVMAFATALEQAEKPDKIAIAPSPVQRAVSPITFTVLSGSGDLKWISGEPYYAVGYGDGLIQVWQCATNQLVSTCYGHTDAIVSVAWSPDGTRLASTSRDRTVRIWKAMTGQSLVVTHRPGIHCYFTNSSPDGTRLVLYYYQEVERLYEVDILDANTGSCLNPQIYKGKFIRHLRWLPDSIRLIIIDSDNTLQIIETTTGRLLASYPNSGIISRDSKYFTTGKVVGEAAYREIKEVATGRLLASYKDEFSDTTENLEWSPDGNYFACAVKDTIQIREVMTGRLVTSYTNHQGQVDAIDWHPVDARIASSSVADKTIQVWEAMNGHYLITYNKQHSRSRFVYWTPDGRQLVDYSSLATVQVVKRATGQVSTIYRGHDKEIDTVVWSPDGTKIASACSDDKTVHVWYAQTGHCLTTYTHSDGDGVRAIAWSPDSKQIASRSGNSVEMHVWHGEIGNHLTTYSCQFPWGVDAVTWSPNGRYLASSSEAGSSSQQIVEIWEVATKQLVTSYTFAGSSSTHYSIAWSPDSTKVANGSTSVIWSPDGKHIASSEKVEIHDAMTGRFLTDYKPASNYRTSVHVWETRTGSSRIICQGTASVESTTWSPDGNYIAAGHSDEIVRIWEIATGKFITAYHGYNGRWGGVTWSLDGNHLAYTARSVEIQTYPEVS